jgi:hypothetical protein
MNRARVRAVNLPVVRTAPFLIGVINDLDFEASAGLVAQGEPMLLRRAVLKRRATAAGVPCLYVNDNFGQWRGTSDRPWHIARHARLQDVVSRHLAWTAEPMRETVDANFSTSGSLQPR